MADPQRVVEGIRNLLHSGTQAQLQQLQALAQEYVEACQEVNRRLARCEEFLRQGLRSEAIHFAQAEPNLLDVLAVLERLIRVAPTSPRTVQRPPSPPTCGGSGSATLTPAPRAIDARITKTSMPYRPAPTPPNTISPSWMLNNGTKPPIGVKESCMELTAPQEASVVTVAKSAELAMPKRVSLPSMFPPACELVGCCAMVEG